MSDKSPVFAFQPLTQSSMPEFNGTIAAIVLEWVIDLTRVRPFYRVKVFIPASELASCDGNELIPDMLSEAVLQTGRRTTTNFLL